MAMTLRPDEQLAEALRQQAEREGRSQSAVALDAIAEYVARRAHQARVGRVLDRVLAEEDGVLRRLGEI
ncbi:MAG: hypothetical protein ACRDS0_16765 [Pseudonocardiaceae bacterium]